MKKLLIISLLGSMAFLGGCTSMESSNGYVIDTQKVYAVNTAARNSSRNVQVIWVNPPLKKVEENK